MQHQYTISRSKTTTRDSHTLTARAEDTCVSLSKIASRTRTRGRLEHGRVGAKGTGRQDCFNSMNAAPRDASFPRALRLRVFSLFRSMSRSRATQRERTLVRGRRVPFLFSITDVYIVSFQTTRGGDRLRCLEIEERRSLASARTSNDRSYEPRRRCRRAGDASSLWVRKRPSARRGPGIVSVDRNVRSKCRCSCVLQFTR